MAKLSKQTDKVAKDPIYEKIIGELKKDKTQYGRKIKLTPEMWTRFLTALQFGATIEQAYIASRMGEKAYGRYQQQSETFREEIKLTKQNVSLKARLNVGQAILGTPDEEFEAQDKKTGEIKTVKIKGTPPDLETSKWWMTTVDKINKEIEEPPLQVGAPKTEAEANLMLRLMNKHSDYVASKSNNNGTNK